MIQRLATGGILNRPRPENPGGSVAGYAGAVLTRSKTWQYSAKLKVPDNITLLPLPPRSPELNPPIGDYGQSPVGQRIENLWQFMRDNRLSNRAFKDYEDVVAHCRETWNELNDQPSRIMSIGLRDRAHAF